MNEELNSQLNRRPADYRDFEPLYMPYKASADELEIHGDELRLEISEMIGANGEVVDPVAEVIEIVREEEEARDNFSPIGDLNARAVRWADEAFRRPPDPESLESFETGAMRVLHRLARRMAPAASEAFRKSLEQMMEPVRTIAVTTLVQGWSHEAAAQQLGCSVETVDFMVEVALSHLEGLVEFHLPRPRPRNRSLDSMWREDIPEDGLSR
jgi:hypothetical protein